ncbi:hypothetical protein [Rathayibacter sp. AY1C6]|uniref:hypothetical protein n=1 Tax=Rathayibacter sp. AY1C6 TaxID=2080539 RepID=UPI0011B09533|nr:hypothetical protein [Rathayibacter sp. AY1C6]
MIQLDQAVYSSSAAGITGGLGFSIVGISPTWPGPTTTTLRGVEPFVEFLPQQYLADLESGVMNPPTIVQIVTVEWGRIIARKSYIRDASGPGGRYVVHLLCDASKQIDLTGAITVANSPQMITTWAFDAPAEPAMSVLAAPLHAPEFVEPSPLARSLAGALLTRSRRKLPLCIVVPGEDPIPLLQAAASLLPTGLTRKLNIDTASVDPGRTNWDVAFVDPEYGTIPAGRTWIVTDLTVPLDLNEGETIDRLIALRRLKLQPPEDADFDALVHWIRAREVLLLHPMEASSEDMASILDSPEFGDWLMSDSSAGLALARAMIKLPALSTRVRLDRLASHQRSRLAAAITSELSRAFMDPAQWNYELRGLARSADSGAFDSMLEDRLNVLMRNGGLDSSHVSVFPGYLDRLASRGTQSDFPVWSAVPGLVLVFANVNPAYQDWALDQIFLGPGFAASLGSTAGHLIGLDRGRAIRALQTCLSRDDGAQLFSNVLHSLDGATAIAVVDVALDVEAVSASMIESLLKAGRADSDQLTARFWSRIAARSGFDDSVQALRSRVVIDPRTGPIDRLRHLAPRVTAGSPPAMGTRSSREPSSSVRIQQPPATDPALFEDPPPSPKPLSLAVPPLSITGTPDPVQTGRRPSKGVAERRAHALRVSVALLVMSAAIVLVHLAPISFWPVCGAIVIFWLAQILLLRGRRRD